MACAIQMSLADHQQFEQTSNQQSNQEEEDMALARALQESEIEERRRQSQVVNNKWIHFVVEFSLHKQYH